MINISYFYDLLESMRNHRLLITCGFISCANSGVHALLLNANFGLPDWSYWSSGSIYVSDFRLMLSPLL